jgi:hypothetical protein
LVRDAPLRAIDAVDPGGVLEERILQATRAMVNASGGQGHRASGTYPSSSKGGAVVSDLVRGTIAAVRCREFLGRQDIASAHLEFMLVQQCLEALEGRSFDESTSMRIQKLREEETRLGRVLVCSLHAP